MHRCDSLLAAGLTQNQGLSPAIEARMAKAAAKAELIAVLARKPGPVWYR